MRVDVMSVMRGVAPFPELWERRTTLETQSGTRVELIALADLVRAKKTQRDRDWPMIRRLVESHFWRHGSEPAAEQIAFWLRECRTPPILFEVVRRFPDQVAAQLPARSLLSLAIAHDETGLAEALAAEERREREADRLYWLPLRKELEGLRRRGHSEGTTG